MAWVSILLETNIGPMSSKGTIICQGNLVEANAMLKKAGNTIAVSQRMVFHLSRFFFSVFFMYCFFLFVIGLLYWTCARTPNAAHHWRGANDLRDKNRT